MARRISVGVVPGGVGDLTVASATISTRDTNQDLILNPDGTGRILSNKNLQLQNQSDLRFADADSSNWVAFEAPATVASNVTWTLPSVVGTAGQVFTVGSGGTISWTDKTVTITNNTSDSTQNNIVFTTASSGTVTGFTTTNNKLQFQPSTGTLTLSGNTASTTVGTGTLIVTGGVGVSGQVTCGTLSATSIVETSSITLKENIEPIKNALSSVLKLCGVTYDRIDNKEHEAGLIAEWVNEVMPEMVPKDSNGNSIGIKYSKLTAYLIEAIKDLKIEIDKLKFNSNGNS
jgi:hypothetical protein